MKVITLEYHDVVDTQDFDSSGFPGPAANSYKLDLSSFMAHLDRLSGLEGAGISVHHLSTAERPILLTFDDGGLSALAVTSSAIERHGFVGHFFITTDRIGTPAFCSAADLRKLAGRGHIVGTHSHSHPRRMARLSDAELDREWRHSTDRLKEILGAPVTVASVPGGYHSNRVALAASRAGIRHLFTSEPVMTIRRVGHCQVFGRYTLRRNSPADEVAALVGVGGVARARQWGIWNAKKVLKTIAGDAYLRLRASILDG